jgi:nucleoside-diphosphate-sugar epimerase
MNALDAYRDVNALVFGGAGFIGRWVVQSLEAAGARVTRPGRAEVDLARPGAAEALVEELRPTITFNLAGYGVDRSEREDALSQRINADLVKELTYAVAAARDEDWTGQHLVHVGSALEFGTVSGDLSDPWHCRPTTTYGRTKLAGSEHVVGAVQRGDLRGLTARLFTVFGAGEHSGRLLPALLDAVASAGPLELTEGFQQRDFTYVGDVAEGLLRLGARTETVEIGALNLATGRLDSVRRFVELAAGVLGIPEERMKFGAVPTRPEEMNHDPVSTELLRRLTAWTPATSIEEGVRRTAQLLDSETR